MAAGARVGRVRAREDETVKEKEAALRQAVHDFVVEQERARGCKIWSVSVWYEGENRMVNCNITPALEPRT